MQLNYSKLNEKYILRKQDTCKTFSQTDLKKKSLRKKAIEPKKKERIKPATESKKMTKSGADNSR